MDFEAALRKVLVKLKKTDITLKEEQKEALRILFSDNNGQLLVKLPTGFGKSLILQLSPFLLGEKRGVQHPVLLVISPLSSLQVDQLRSAGDLNIPSCRLNYNCKAELLCAQDDDNDDDGTEVCFTSFSF